MTVITLRAGHMMAQFAELKKIRKVGNSSATPKTEEGNINNVKVINNETIPSNSPPPQRDDMNIKKPKIDKISEKAPRKRQPAGGKTTKTPNKKVEPKKEARKAIYLYLRPSQPQPKPMKQVNVMSAVSNRKIHKLQQPMQRALPLKAVR